MLPSITPQGVGVLRPEDLIGAISLFDHLYRNGD